MGGTNNKRSSLMDYCFTWTRGCSLIVVAETVVYEDQEYYECAHTSAVKIEFVLHQLSFYYKPYTYPSLLDISTISDDMF